MASSVRRTGCAWLRRIDHADISGGSLTLTSVVSLEFNPTGQDIVANASYTGELTTMTNTSIGLGA